VESDQGQPPRSPVICPPLPVLETMMDDERENLHREVGEPQVAFAVEQVSQREQETTHDRLRTEEGGTKEELPVQPRTNDGRAELVLHSQGWRVEMTDSGTTMWLVIEKQDGTNWHRRIFT